MKGSQQRMSRALAAGVGVTLTLGVVFWAYNLGKTQGAASQKPATPHTPAVAIVPPPPAAAAPTTAPAPNSAVLTTPTGPTTAPSALLAAVDTERVGPTTRATGGNAQIASAVNPGKAPKAVAEVQVAGGTPMADAKAKMDAGKTLEARRILNAAITSGKLSDADTKSAKEMLSKANQTVIFSSQRFDDPPYVETITVEKGSAFSKIAIKAETTPELLMRINNISNPSKLQAGKSLKVVKGPFNAVVTKSAFTIDLWQGAPGEKGSMYVMTLPVGLGKDDSTPTGAWAVGAKLKNPAYYSPHGEGVIAADDPKNPLGEYWMTLIGTEGQAVGKQSYGIHGTIDPDSIGKMESMGCIRMRNEDVAKVFELLSEGKSIVVVKD